MERLDEAERERERERERDMNEQTKVELWRLPTEGDYPRDSHESQIVGRWPADPVVQHHVWVMLYAQLGGITWE